MPQQIDFDPSVDYYKALGLTEKATADEIKRAYRKLAKANHPDSTGGDKKKESRFKDVSNAYDVLGEPKKRALYDQIRASGGMPHGSPFPGGGGGYTYSSQGGGPGVFDLGDLFSQFFSGNVRGGGAGGPRMRMDPFGDDDQARRRRGASAQDVELESKVKASDGSWLRVEGVDVHSDVRISFDRAILGTVASVITIDGKADVKIPAGTSSGKRLRLRGKGVSDRSGRVGDHYVTVHIDVPGDLDDDAKKQLVDLVTRLRRKTPSGGGHRD
ncbi:MAG: J domain-containing protein [Deltaproteobacteria bacterium]|nr:J domain-containing protein [Deltaproteobacteria bacterium]MDQ3297744.1 DnaJ domain-containing protein [Myxococcota bacterium]